MVPDNGPNLSPHIEGANVRKNFDSADKVLPANEEIVFMDHDYLSGSMNATPKVLSNSIVTKLNEPITEVEDLSEKVCATETDDSKSILEIEETVVEVAEVQEPMDEFSDTFSVDKETVTEDNEPMAKVEELSLTHDQSSASLATDKEMPDFPVTADSTMLITPVSNTDSDLLNKQSVGFTSMMGPGSLESPTPAPAPVLTREEFSTPGKLSKKSFQNRFLSQSHKNEKNKIKTMKKEAWIISKPSKIYKSAQDELELLLEKKELINLDNTFNDLAGKKRKRYNSKKENGENSQQEKVLKAETLCQSLSAKNYYKCQYCDYKSNFRSNMERHQKRRHKDQKNKQTRVRRKNQNKIKNTNVIGKQSKTRRPENKTERKQKTALCPACGLYKSRSNISRHLRIIHGIDSNKIGKAFVKLQNIKTM